MATATDKLNKKLGQKGGLDKIKSVTKDEFKGLKESGLSKNAALRSIRSRITKSVGIEGFKALGGANQKSKETPIETNKVETNGITGTDVNDVDNVNGKGKEKVVDTAGQTLRDKVAAQVAGKKTREEQLKAEQDVAGRGELLDLRKGFREEAGAVQEDLANIKKGLEAEGGAITSIAASRIREARSAPLREQLTSLVKGQELTSASLKEMDSSIDAILEARKLDRQDEVTKLTNSIEASNLSDTEKNNLISQLGVQTKRMENEEELEAFRQKEQIKADIAAQDIDSLAKTGLTAEQALQSSKIIEEFEVKEDSIAGQGIRKLLKEGKTPEQIRKILGLAEGAGGKIDDIQFTRQEKLRKEFEANATVKNYLEATQQFAGVISSLGTATGPGDMAAVFQFMKTLDPSSVVRESEFSSAAESSGILDRITSLQILKKAETGQLLTPKQRVQFASIAEVLFNNRKEAFDQRATKFIKLSKEAGANPRSVVLDFENIPGFASDLTESDFAPIGGDSSDDEIINFLNKGASNTFNTDSKDADIGNFLDEDFSMVDQTTEKKDTISFIKEQEGFSPKSFSDFKQTTSGFGTRALPGEKTITQEEAEKRLIADVTRREKKVDDVFGKDLTEGQKTALTSFMFNLGVNIFNKPEARTLKDAIVRGDEKVIRQEFIKFNKAGGKTLSGLTARRKRELEQFFINS